MLKKFLRLALNRFRLLCLFVAHLHSTHRTGRKTIYRTAEQKLEPFFSSNYFESRFFSWPQKNAFPAYAESCEQKIPTKIFSLPLFHDWFFPFFLSFAFVFINRTPFVWAFLCLGRKQHKIIITLLISTHFNLLWAMLNEMWASLAVAGSKKLRSEKCGPMKRRQMWKHWKGLRDWIRVSHKKEANFCLPRLSTRFSNVDMKMYSWLHSSPELQGANVRSEVGRYLHSNETQYLIVGKWLIVYFCFSGSAIC